MVTTNQPVETEDGVNLGNPVIFINLSPLIIKVTPVQAEWSNLGHESNPCESEAFPFPAAITLSLPSVILSRTIRPRREERSE